MALPALRNRVGMSVSSVASAGTGAYTLNAALADHQSFATAYGADAVVGTLAVEAGVGWELARTAAYTHSGTTLSRGTLEASSTGSAVAFSSAVEVYVIQTAGEALQSMYRSTAHTVTTANIDLVVNAWNYCTIAGLTADRDALLPATAAEGDWVGVHVLDGDADYELLLKANTGDTINGGSAGAEWSRLFIAGERVVFRCTTANSAWLVERDERIAMKARITLSTAVTANAAATYEYPTACSGAGAWTATIDNGNLTAVAADRINLRRAATALVGVGFRTNATVSDTKYVNGAYDVNGAGSPEFAPPLYAALTGQTAALFGSIMRTFAAGDYIRYMMRTEEANKGAAASPQTHLWVIEILP
jgi:hypothetical protein